MTNAIEIDRLEKRYERFTLGPLTLTIPRGSIYGLVGPNGAGKTTLLELLMGIGETNRGTMRVLGHDPGSDGVAVRQRTAFVGPDLNYVSWKTVQGALRFVSGFYPDWDHERCSQLQLTFNVPDSTPIAALSFGSRIKLSLIMALSRNAELLLLDEPTVGLDAIARRQVFTELLVFMQNEARTVVISSHQLADLERFADHIAIVNDGHILAAGAIDDLLATYVQVDARLTRSELPDIDRVRVLRRQGDRVQLLIERPAVTTASLAALGFEVIAESPLTLEELFIGLLGRAPTTAELRAAS
jgi:ABC-2 type transport system ATP-binding protein